MAKKSEFEKPAPKKEGVISKAAHAISDVLHGHGGEQDETTVSDRVETSQTHAPAEPKAESVLSKAAHAIGGALRGKKQVHPKFQKFKEGN